MPVCVAVEARRRAVGSVGVVARDVAPSVALRIHPAEVWLARLIFVAASVAVWGWQ